MKNLFLAFLLLTLTTSFASGTSAVDKYSYSSYTDNIKVAADDYMTFVKMPWKCRVLNEAGDTLTTVYYDREGQIKAIGGQKADGRFYYTFYEKSGKNYDVYHLSNSYDENGELVRNGSKELNQKAWVKPDLGKNVPESIKHNDTSHIDKYGNWVYGGDWNKRIIREIYYYDDGYDAAEDENLAVMLEEAKVKHYEATSFKFSSIPVMITGRLIQFVWLGLIIYLFMLLFMREKAYGVFNKWAGTRITPYGLFSKTQLQGIIPVLILLLPSYIYFGSITSGSGFRIDDSDFFMWGVVMLLSLAAMLLYCSFYIKYKVNSGAMTKKVASATIAFAIWSILALVAVIAIAVVAIWIAIVLFFVWTGVGIAIGGFISGGAGVAGSGAAAIQLGGGTAMGKNCVNCTHYSNGVCTRLGCNQSVSSSDVCGYHQWV